MNYVYRIENIKVDETLVKWNLFYMKIHIYVFLKNTYICTRFGFKNIDESIEPEDYLWSISKT